MKFKRNKRNRNIRFIKLISLTSLIFFVVSIFSSAGIYFYFSRNLPDLSLLKNYHPNITTKVYSDQGEIIGEFYLEKRIVVPLSRIPKILIQAFVSAEDRRFYEHSGINFLSIMRAFFKNIKAGKIVQGGSTITQQVTKYFLLSPERRFSRKIKEVILAYRIENQLSKEDILYLYLNQIYLGHGAYGVESAALNYFGKHVEDLNLAESSLLAGLPRAPNKYSPLSGDPKTAKKRQAYVLQRLLDDGHIDSEQVATALKTPLEIKGKDTRQIIKAPYFTEHVRRYIERKYGSDSLYKEGLQIYTTVNLDMQNAAQIALKSGIIELEERQKYQEAETALEVQGALICMDTFTGHVKAMVGGKDFYKSQFNRAIQAKRQAGSAYKPIIYSAALDKGFTPATIIVDSPIIYDEPEKDETWKPRNFGRKFYGPITFRDALAKSRNVVTVKILRDIKIDYAADYARKLGVTTPINMDLTMALGSSSISLLDLTRVYGVFNAQGKRIEPIFITRILDRSGKTIEENIPQAEKVISEQTAYIITNLLKGVVQRGTGWRAKALGRPCAGKTGTTNNQVDAWFIGFTPDLIAGCWVGFDDYRGLGDNETGSRAALPIWLKFMKQALKESATRDFPIPKGIVFVKIDQKTGLLATLESTHTLFESFKEGTEPQEFANTPVKMDVVDFFRLDAE
ncbi:MAG: PBP1A family penicillin-binding protein [Thermodesulfobacteriota bacterium]|nr:PBP1A family penicillin-binding protein [Thermodesulfobacteriota bacterium]